jgi:hypothetical protein
MARTPTKLDKMEAPCLTADDLVVDGVASDLFTITPEMAEILIENNSLNRPMSDRHADDLGDQMKKGKWRRNGEAIIISIEGMILDGQHRLWACFKSKKEFETFVTRGIDKDTFATIDTGKKRSGSDALVIHSKMTGKDLKYTSQLSAAATMCIEIQKGTLKKKGSKESRISRQDIIDYVDKNEELITWVERSRSRKTWTTSYSAGIASICYLASKNGYEMKALAFMHGFITGENLDGRSPIMALRNRLGVEKNMAKAERLALMIHALNKFIDGEPLMILKLPKGEVPQIHESVKQLKRKKEQVRQVDA